MAKVYQFEEASTSSNNTNGIIDSNDYEEHLFSDDYNKKKKQILAAYEELPRHKTIPVIKVAVALLAVILISGTTMAYNSDVLDSFFRKGKEKIDTKYQLIDLARTSYDGVADVTTNSDNDNIDVSVLAAMRGERTITVAFLLTLNDTAVPEIPGYSPMSYFTFTGKERLIGVDDPVNDPECIGQSVDGINWGGTGENDYGLNKNQILMYNEYKWDDQVDISKVTGMVFTIDSIALDYVSDEHDQFGQYDNRLRYILSPEEDEPLEITIAFSDEAYKDYDYEINDSIAAFKDEYFIDHISITPISLSVWLDAAKTEALNDISYSGIRPHIFNIGALMPDTEDKVYLIMTDGEKIRWKDIGSGGSSGESQDKKLVEDSLDFDVPIDPSQVAGVQIDGKTIMFEDYR